MFQKESVVRLFKVFDATNTTAERRDVILGFAKDNGYKVTILLLLSKMETEK